MSKRARRSRLGSSLLPIMRLPPDALVPHKHRDPGFAGHCMRRAFKANIALGGRLRAGSLASLSLVLIFARIARRKLLQRLGDFLRGHVAQVSRDRPAVTEGIDDGAYRSPQSTFRPMPA